LRKFINIPSKEARIQIKDILKEGLRYCPYGKCDYVNTVDDYQKVSHLLNHEQKTKGNSFSSTHPQAQFSEFITQHGFMLDTQPIMDGVKHVLKRNKKVKGQYKAFLDGVPNGWVKDFVSGERHKWVYSGDYTLIPKVSNAQIAQKLYDNFVKEKEENRAVGKKAKEIWDNKGTDVLETPYTQKKDIKKYSAKINEDLILMIALRNINSFLTNIQFIDPTGNKKFMKGGTVVGSFAQIGYINNRDIIILCEGYATGATLHEQLRRPVVCSMTASNLPVVAALLKEKYPYNKIAIAADNDRFQKNAIVNENAGLIKAKEAQKLLGDKCHSLLLPKFKDHLYEEERHDLIDWNDFQKEYGNNDFENEMKGQGMLPKRIRKSKQQPQS
jgi:putative DNA primase/helicase